MTRLTSVTSEERKDGGHLSTEEEQQLQEVPGVNEVNKWQRIDVNRRTLGFDFAVASFYYALGLPPSGCC